MNVDYIKIDKSFIEGYYFSKPVLQEEIMAYTYK